MTHKQPALPGLIRLKHEIASFLTYPAGGKTDPVDWVTDLERVYEEERKAIAMELNLNHNKVIQVIYCLNFPDIEHPS